MKHTILTPSTFVFILGLGSAQVSAGGPHQMEKLRTQTRRVLQCKWPSDAPAIQTLSNIARTSSRALPLDKLVCVNTCCSFRLLADRLEARMELIRCF
jgi:hypothetical protein